MCLLIYCHTRDVLQAQCLQSSGFPLHRAANLSCHAGEPAHPSPGLSAQGWAAASPPTEGGMERGSTSLGTEEGCTPFFWDSEIRPLVPSPALSLASACLGRPGQGAGVEG